VLLRLLPLLFCCHCHRVKASCLVWRVPVSEDGELSSPQRVFKLHFSSNSKMHVTGGSTAAHCAMNPRLAV
jgi:hypothetical protein